MNTYMCPNCGKGKVHTVKRRFEATIKGVASNIPDALLETCDLCGFESVSKAEMQRWRQIVDARIQASSVFLAPRQIRKIRESLNLAIPQFARLLGATRQSVHNWERLDRKAPQLRTVDLLLRLVRKAQATGAIDVLRFLETEAQELEAVTSGHIKKAQTWILAGSEGFHFLPKEIYDKNFDSEEVSPDLPLLTVH